ncbi:MAG TPA: hypothetical protein VK390_03585, partial [Propionibacteriaceae bacterium]|nr:hypothetical protein [Propionibacteriaceae bacterium]
MPIRLDRGEHRHTILARRNAAPVLEDQHRYEQSLCSYLNDVSTHHIGGAAWTLLENPSTHDYALAGLFPQAS